MKFHLRATFVSALALGLAGISAAQVGVDGVLGSEWSSTTATSVLYNPTAPVGNFGTPSNLSNTVAYDIYLRSDNSYVYGLLKANPAGSGNDGWTTANNFANLYFSTNPFGLGGSGSGSIGFELQNDRAFKPGGSGYLSGSLSSLGFVTVLNSGTDYSGTGVGSIIEFAMPWSYFYSDPQSAPFVPITGVNNALRLNLSQSFGYSVAGGATDYGTNRLGVVYAPVPEPMTLATLGSGLLALAARRRRKANS